MSCPVGRGMVCARQKMNYLTMPTINTQRSLYKKKGPPYHTGPNSNFLTATGTSNQQMQRNARLSVANTHTQQVPRNVFIVRERVHFYSMAHGSVVHRLTRVECECDQVLIKPSLLERTKQTPTECGARCRKLGALP